MTDKKVTRYGLTYKILITIPDNPILRAIEKEAEIRGITKEALIRAVVIPDWIKKQDLKHV